MATLAARSLHAGRPAASIAVLSTMAAFRLIFYQGLVLSRPASFNGYSVNNAAAMAVLSARSGQMARSPHSGFAWPISYCPVPSERQPQRFIKAGGRVIKPMIVLSSRPKPNGHFIKTEQAQWPVCQANGRFIKKLPNWPDLQQIYATGCESHMIPCEQVISSRASSFSFNA